MAKAKVGFRVKYEAYTRNGRHRDESQDYEKTVEKGSEIHNNTAEMLEDPFRYDWGRGAGGYIYTGTFSYLK